MSLWRTFVPSWMDLISMGAEIKLKFLFLSYLINKYSFHNFSEEPLDIHQSSLGCEVSLGNKIKHVKPQVLIDQIWTEYLPELYSCSSYFCIYWSWPWIPTSIMMVLDFIKRTLIYDCLFSIDSNGPHIFLNLCRKFMNGWWIWYCINDMRNYKIFIIQ